MLRAVLDVNVLVSAIIVSLGIPHHLVEAWHQRRFTLIASEPVITQTVTKLRLPRIARRYHLAPTDVNDFEAIIRARATMVTVTTGDVLPITGDPEDDAVLATAALGQAQYLVTGDHGLLALGAYAGARILTPRMFMELLDGGEVGLSTV